VVRGLISIVRQGKHVGVLMASRPTALALVVAISRLGAISVLLRPGEIGVLEIDIEGAETSGPTVSVNPRKPGRSWRLGAWFVADRVQCRRTIGRVSACGKS